MTPESFELASPFRPMGDQPQAIDQLTEGVRGGRRWQTLLGATGTGKTFTIANVIQRCSAACLGSPGPAVQIECRS